MVSSEENNAKAIVTKTLTENGTTVKEEVIFEGTLAEVNENIADLKNE